MGSFSIHVRWEVLRSINSSTFTGSYQAIGTPLVHDCFLVKMISEANVAILVSTDGTNDHDRIPAGTAYFLYDEQSNSSRVGGLRIPAGTQFYVKGSAGIGSVYLIAQYAD